MKILQKYGREKTVHIILTALVCILLLGLPMVIDSSYILFLMLQVFINIIIIQGLNIITGLTGQMHFGTGAIFSIGAYTSAIITTRLGVSPWIGMLAAIIMGWIVGKVLGYPGLKVKGVYLWLITIAFNQVVNVLEKNLTGLTGGTQGIKGIPYFSIFGFTFRSNQSMYYLYLAFTAIAVLLAMRIVHSRWGRLFRAVRDNEEAMRSNGIDDSSVKILAFTISTMYACFAGALYSHAFTYITPSAFADLSTNYLVMMMIGGIGSIPGSSIGAALITLLPEMMRSLQQYYWLIFSSVTLLMTIFWPQGIISLFHADFWQTTLRKIKSKKERIEYGDHIET